MNEEKKIDWKKYWKKVLIFCSVYIIWTFIFYKYIFDTYLRHTFMRISAVLLILFVIVLVWEELKLTNRAVVVTYMTVVLILFLLFMIHL